MAALKVEASARWSGGVPDFNLFPIYVVVSVSHEDGTPVSSLDQSAFAVGFLQEPDHPSVQGTTDAFHATASAGPHGLQGYYSFVTRPIDEGTPTHFIQDDATVLVTARAAGNHGQTLTFVRYRLL